MKGKETTLTGIWGEDDRTYPNVADGDQGVREMCDCKRFFSSRGKGPSWQEAGVAVTSPEGGWREKD